MITQLFHLWVVIYGLLSTRCVVAGSVHSIWLVGVDLTKLSAVMRAPRIVGINSSKLSYA